ncbi:unnamed protein product [Brachionus calyciflorus]|uniref:Polycystin cation channel PKD1/PKD2 domain-containing protein n=1 Tax=Brachionus calyciflorus TaxID=104777 RepID=A0A813V6R2_9BILA|nr:unnamed protein product [Brachionus calyciflorus]
MRFFQQHKFSYLIRKLNRVDRIESNDELFKNDTLYDKFLKATLIETLITFTFVFISIRFHNLYYDFNKAIQGRYNDTDKILYLDRPVEPIILDLYTDLTNNDDISLKDWRNLLVKKSNNIGLTLNDSARGPITSRDNYLIVIRYKLELNENSKSLRELIQDSKCSNTLVIQSDLTFYFDPINYLNDRGCFRSFRNITSLVNIRFIGFEKKGIVKIADLDSNFKNSTIIKKFFYLKLALQMDRLEFLVFLVLYTMFLVYYFIEEFLEFVHYKSEYFTNYSNFIDFMVLLLSFRLVGFLIFKITFQIEVSDILSKNKRNIEENYIQKWMSKVNTIEMYTDFFTPDMELNLAILQVILLWIKIFKYVNFSTGLTQMNAALSKASNHLISYLFIYTLVFCLHAELMHRLFGTTVGDYSTRIMAQFTMFRMLLANINFKFISENPDAQMIFFSFYSTVFIIFSGNYYFFFLCGIFNDREYKVFF